MDDGYGLTLKGRPRASVFKCVPPLGGTVLKPLGHWRETLEVVSTSYTNSPCSLLICSVPAMN